MENRVLDNKDEPLEIERKYLVKMPDTDMIASLDGCAVYDIEQVYLVKDNDGCRPRIRKRSDAKSGKTEYFLTKKYRLSKLTCIEKESEISGEEYRSLLPDADTSLSPIKKRRFAFPWKEKIFELDVYVFWNDRATLEIELSSEDEKFSFPPFIEIIKEVSFDERYKNLALAREIVNEEI